MLETSANVSMDSDGELKLPDDVEIIQLKTGRKIGVRRYNGAEIYICLHCGKEATRRKSMVDHVWYHYQNNICNTCNKYFKQPQDMKNHTCNPKMPVAQAPVLSFANESNSDGEPDFDPLMMDVGDEYAFNLSNNPSVEVIQLRGGKRIGIKRNPAGDIFVCLICEKESPKRKAIVDHLWNHYQKSVCPFCSRTFATINALKKHIYDEHANDEIQAESGGEEEAQDVFPDMIEQPYPPDDDPIDPSMIPPGVEVIVLKSGKKMGFRPSDETYICLICGKENPRRKSMVDHTWHHHQKNMCKVCSQTFATPTNLEAHMQTQHLDHIEEENNAADVEAVDVDENVVNDEASDNEDHGLQNPILEHLSLRYDPGNSNSHDDDDPIDEASIPDDVEVIVLKSGKKMGVRTLSNGKQTYVCLICKKSNPRRKSIVDHTWHHYKKNTCKICSKTFSTKSNLNKHLRYIHKRDPQAEEATEADNEAEIDHDEENEQETIEKEGNEENKAYEEPESGEMDSENPLVHLSLQFDEPESSAPAEEEEEIDEDPVDMSKVKKGVRIEILKTGKKLGIRKGRDLIYVCLRCGVEKKNRKKMTNHMWHHYQRNACSFCSQSFGSPENLKRHIKNAHPEEYVEEPEKPEKDTTADQPTQTQQRQQSNSSAKFHFHRADDDDPIDMSKVAKDVEVIILKTGRKIGRRIIGKSEMFVCLICAKENPRRKKMTDHLWNHYQRNTCQLCPKAFATPENLATHLRLLHSEGLQIKEEIEDDPSLLDPDMTDQDYMEADTTIDNEPHVDTMEDDDPIDKSKIPPGIQIVLLKSGRKIGMKRTNNGAFMFVCLQCGIEKRERKKLTDHVWYHYSRNTCSFCMRTFCSPENLKLHLTNVHSQQPDISFSDDDMANLLAPEVQINDDTEASILPDDLDENDDFESNEESNSYEPPMQQLASDVKIIHTTTGKKIGIRKLPTGQLVYVCVHCGVEKFNQKHILQHTWYHFSRKCAFCSRAFKTQDDLMEHLQLAHSNEVQDEENGDENGHNSSFGISIANEPISLDPSSMLEQQWEQESLDNDDDPELETDLDDIKIPTIDKSKLPSDVQIIKLIKSGKEMGYRKLPDGKEMFLCLYCGREDSGRKVMTTHIWYHFQNNDCRLCGQKYTRPDGLRRHLKTAHRGVKYSEAMFKPVINESSRSQSNASSSLFPNKASAFEITMLDENSMAMVETSIESRMRQNDGDEPKSTSMNLRSRVCGECGKKHAPGQKECTAGWQFEPAGNSSQTRHFEQNNTSTPVQNNSNVRLPVGTKIVNLKSGKQIGVRKTAKGEMMYVCLICGREKNDRKSFMIHVQYHKYPEVRCCICSKTFTKPSNLKRHIFTVHVNHPEQEKALQTLTSRNGNNSNTGDTEDMEFACGFCPLSFSKITNLQIHQRLVHDMEEEINSEPEDESFILPSSNYEGSYYENTNGPKRRRLDNNSMENYYPDTYEDETELQQEQTHFDPDTNMEILVLKTGKKIGIRRQSNGQPIYVCLECGKEDARRKSLVNHVWYHNTKTTCKYCSLSFSSNNLRKHIMAQHPEVELDAEEEAFEIKEEPISDSEDFDGNPFEPEMGVMDPQNYDDQYEDGSSYAEEAGGQQDAWQPHFEMSLTDDPTQKVPIQLIVLRSGKKIGLRRLETGEMVYVCLHCKKQDSNRKNLVKHVYRHYTEMVCRLCQKQFASPSNWRRHLRVVHPDQAEEIIQQERGTRNYVAPSTNNFYEDEIDASESASQNFDMMNAMTFVSAQLDEGQMDESQDFTIENEELSYGDNQNNSFNQQTEIRKVVLRSGKILGMKTLPSGKVMFVCTVCYKEHENRKAITDHMWVHFKRYNCKLCQRSFNRPERLKNHMQLAHEYNETESPGFSSEAFKMEIIQIKSGRLGIQRMKTGESIYQCLECGREGTNRKLITKHMWNTHTQTTCKICSQKFSSPSVLKRHMASSHTDAQIKQNGNEAEARNAGSASKVVDDDEEEEPVGANESLLVDTTVEDVSNQVFHCPHCAFTTNKKPSLSKHIKWHISDFKCTICEKCFPGNFYLKRHMNTVHSKEQQNYNSDNQEAEANDDETMGEASEYVDPEIMPDDDSMNEEIGSEMLGNEGNEDGDLEGIYWFSCPLCTYKGKKKSNLDKHMKYHNSKYQCPECQKYFPDPSHLKRHMNVHGNRLRSDDSVILSDDDDVEIIC